MNETEWYKDYLITVKKYNALVDIARKYQEIIGKKSIQRLISKKNVKEIVSLIDKYLQV